jgi:hypothetical protein
MTKKYQVVATQDGYRQRIGKPHTSLTEAEKKVKVINKKKQKLNM